MATIPPRGARPVAPAPAPRAGTGRPTVRPTVKAPAPAPTKKTTAPPPPPPKQPLPKGLTPKQLLQLGRRFWGRNSQWVKLARAKKTGDSKTAATLSVITYSTHDNYGVKRKPKEINRYLTTMTSLDHPGVPLSKARRIKVSCQCKSHKYGCEYKLWKLGAADLVYSNGKAPQTYFPNTPAVCKHVFKTVLEVLRRGL